MKKIGKSTFFIVVAIIALFSCSAIFGVDYRYGDIPKTIIKGVDDIRLGIDIKGGVDATFEPADDYDASSAQLDAATEIIKTRLSSLGITDSEV
ncbi:MAG: protein translocase subunit SecD, partial [Ruminococcus sp.]|nr:protein translocase subunit SecD [Ruminococcus sp.]